MTGVPTIFLRAFSLLAALLLSSVVFAQAPIRVEVQEGFDGYYKPGKWTPIFVLTANQPSGRQTLAELTDFEGQLMMSTSPIEGGSSMRFVRRIDVPRASSKRYNLYVKLSDKISGGLPVPLLLNAANGKFLQNYPLKFTRVPPDGKLYVHVTEALTRPSFPQMRTNVNTVITTGISPAMLPDYWAAYDSVDVLAFSGWPDKGMTAEVRQAVTDWVHTGGTMVFLGGVDTPTYNDPTSADFLPVTIEGSIQIQELENSFRVVPAETEVAAGTRAYVASDIAAKEGSEVLLSLDGKPLIVRRRMGNGQVVFFANDLKSQSAELERYLAPTWLAVMPVANLAAAEVDVPATIQRFRSLTGRAARPPNQFIIILICIAYTLAVGPLNFGWLGRRKKLEWAWLTVPVIVFVFFFLIYGMGRLTKGDSRIVRELAVERYTEGSSNGSGTTIFNTFVSSPGSHSLTPMGQRHAIADPHRWEEYDPYRQHNFLGGMFPAGTGGNLPASGSSPLLSYDTREGESGKMENIQISSWKMGTYDASAFVSQGPVELKGQLETKLTWGEGGPVGSLVNNTEHDFEEAWLVAGTDAIRLGELKKGDEFVLTPTDSLRAFTPTAQGGGRSSRWLPLNALLDSSGDGSEEDTAISRANASLLLSVMYEPGRTGAFLAPRRGALTFVGYRTEEQSGLITSIDAETRSRAVLTMVDLKAAPRKGASFVVVNEYIQHRLHVYETGREGFFTLNQGNQFELQNAQAVFSVELPFSDPDLEVTSFAIFPTVIERPGQTIKYSVYRHGSQPGWIEIQPEQAITNQNMALPVNGRIYYRVESAPNTANPQAVSMWDSNQTRIENMRVRIDGRVR